MASRKASTLDSSTMRAWQVTSGSGDMEKRMHLAEAAPRPLNPPSSNEIQVEVHSAALNPVDHKLTEIPVVGGFAVKTPFIPGLDFAGRVVATGSGVTRFKEGDMVFGMLPDPAKPGTLAQYANVAEESTAKIPEGVSADQAAASALVGLTAYCSLVPNLPKSPGARVFINGGSGGTGTMGIQIAKALGCHVTTSCSTPNVALCKELGADEVLDYKKVDLSKELSANHKPFDLVVDNVGTPFDLHKASDKFLVEGGKFAQVGAQMSISSVRSMAGRALLPSILGGGKRKWEFVQVKAKAHDLERMAEWMREGKVKPVIEEVFKFEDVPKAYEKLKLGRTKGKLVVRVVGKPAEKP